MARSEVMKGIARKLSYKVSEVIDPRLAHRSGDLFVCDFGGRRHLAFCDAQRNPRAEKNRKRGNYQRQGWDAHNRRIVHLLAIRGSRGAACLINGSRSWLCGPQGLKPAFLAAVGGTAEAVPFPFVARLSFSACCEAAAFPSPVY